MADIQLVDVSLRDGNQSLWGATGLRTAHILQIAPVMDRVGFRALDFTSSTHMGVAVRTHREDPWERIRLTHAAAPNTPLQFIGSGLRFISWEPVHPELMQLAYDRLVVAGMSRFVVLDPMHDMDSGAADRADAPPGRRGTRSSAALTYTVSAVHDDAFYAGLAGQMAASPDIDRVYVKDPAGPARPRNAPARCSPRSRPGSGGMPLELHSHCTIGLSPLTCLVAAELGVDVAARGVRAAGQRHVAAERRAAGREPARARAHRRRRRPAAGPGGRYFTRLAAAESLPPGSRRSTTPRSCGTRWPAG